MTMKKIISFDLDGTLVHGKYGNMVWNHGIPQEYSRKHGMPFKEAEQLIRHQYEEVGEANIKWYHIEYWLKRFDLPVSAKTLLDRFESYIEVFPDTKEVLEALKNTYTLIVASNAAQIFVQKELSYANLTSYFTHIISATSDYCMVKKEIRFYEKLCDTLSISPYEIVHVGDHHIFDFETPSQLGIDAYHFVPDHKDSSNQSHTDNGKTIHCLSDLLNIL
ncbi:MAG: HAD family hydrolase [Syntrophorhabdus sp.]